jgi:hypothetical protein
MCKVKSAPTAKGMTAYQEELRQIINPSVSTQAAPNILTCQRQNRGIDRHG